MGGSRMRWYPFRGVRGAGPSAGVCGAGPFAGVCSWRQLTPEPAGKPVPTLATDASCCRNSRNRVRRLANVRRIMGVVLRVRVDLGEDARDGGAVVTSNDEDASRRQRWEGRTRNPLLFGSAFFLLAYSVLILVPQMAVMWRVVVIAALSIVWAAYIIDLLVRVSLTPRGQRSEFIRTHPADTASAFIPWVRPFTLLKYLSRIPWFSNANGDSIRSRMVVAALAYTILFVYVIALGVLAVERNTPDATIVSFGDAIWWACVTVTTVGYGDFSPVTVIGRTLGVVLMTGGVAIIGTASATIVSLLNERIGRARQQHLASQVDPPTTSSAET
ncbi:hypothetical protein CVS27_02530 [Arthrobacter glacialis]|uniref:Potassium channel domain-containing protein n=1 Tax=Arthrobacter glacialis TaxID=1664 RepID=A0A2S3ZZW8_ARTGL|nr:hypothetical protein CVS27_02530 [Arthrobacter glacialis]